MDSLSGPYTIGHRRSTPPGCFLAHVKVHVKGWGGLGTRSVYASALLHGKVGNRTEENGLGLAFAHCVMNMPCAMRRQRLHRNTCNITNSLFAWLLAAVLALKRLRAMPALAWVAVPAVGHHQLPAGATSGTGAAPLAVSTCTTCSNVGRSRGDCAQHALMRSQYQPGTSPAGGSAGRRPEMTWPQITNGSRTPENGTARVAISSSTNANE